MRVNDMNPTKLHRTYCLTQKLASVQMAPLTVICAAVQLVPSSEQPPNGGQGDVGRWIKSVYGVRQHRPEETHGEFIMGQVGAAQLKYPKLR